MVAKVFLAKIATTTVYVSNYYYFYPSFFSLSYYCQTIAFRFRMIEAVVLDAPLGVLSFATKVIVTFNITLLGMYCTV